MIVRIGADVTQMKVALKGAAAKLKAHSAQFRKAGMAMTVAGGAITGAVGLMVKSYMSAGDEVHKMALRTGIGTEALSELKYAAEISGASLDDVEKGVKKMSKTIMDAKDGLATYVRAFDRIGLQAEDLIELSPEDQFDKIARAIANVENPTIRAATAQEIFGRAGTKLLPLFAAGEEGLDALRQKARDMGIVFDQEAADKAAVLTDSLTTLKGSFSGVSMSIANTLAPVITTIVDKISDVAQKVKDWMKEHPKLAGTIMKVVVVLGGLMAVLGPLVMILPALAAGFALLMGPIGLVIIAVMAVAAGAALVIKNWAKIKMFFVKLWQKIKEIFFTVVEFIFEKVIWLMEKLSKIPIIKKFVKNIQGGLEDAKASLAAARENMKLSAEEMATETAKAGDTIKTSLEEVGTATETMAIKVSSLYNTLVDEIKKATLSEYEYSKWTAAKKYEERKALLEKEIEEGKAQKGDLLLLEEAHNLSMAEIEAAAAEEKKLKREEQFASYLEAKQALVDSINQMTMSELEYAKWARGEEYRNQMDTIKKMQLSKEEKNELIAALNEKRRLEEEEAEQKHADEMTLIQANTMSALASLYGDFIGDTLDAFEAWGAGTQSLLKGIGQAFGNLAKSAIQALKDIVRQEAVTALKTLIKEKGKAIAKVITSVMSLPFPLNIALVGGAIAAVTMLFSKIKLFKEGGFVPKPTLAMLHAGEYVVKASDVKAISRGDGGFILRQTNHFYGDISNVGDLDEISKRLAVKTRRAVERGRK